MWLLAIIAIFIIYAVIAGAISKRKQKEADKAAKDILKDFDFQKEKQEILSINKSFIPQKSRCPLCNGFLLLRSGIYGKFFGCSNYPNCRFTRKAKSI